MSKYFTTTYIDSEGRVHTGYVKDGKTYKDAEHTKRIDPGTVVSTLGGSYIMTENGGVKLSEYKGNTTAVTSGGGEYLKNAKSGAIAAQKRRNEAAIAELEAGRSGINESYDALAREAYAAYRMGNEGLANGLAASGLYRSGYSDTLRAEGLSSYREGLSRTQRERVSKLNELDREIARTRAEGESRLGEIESEYALAELKQYNTERDLNYKLSRDEVEDARYAEEAAYQKQKDAASEALKKATEAAKYGDYGLLADLGIDTSAYQAEKEAKVRSEQEAQTWSRALDAMSAGDTSLLKALGVDTSAYERKRDWAEAIDALSVGDTSLLQELGVDTSYYDKKLSDKLASEAYSEAAGLSPLEMEEAVQYAKSFVTSQLESGNGYEYITERLRVMESDVRRIFGDGFWEVYLDTCLSLLPGSLTYVEPKAEEERYKGPSLYTAKEYYILFDDMLKHGKSRKEVDAILDQTGLSEQEKIEIKNLLVG